jgi:hypothetical protein
LEVNKLQILLIAQVVSLLPFFAKFLAFCSNVFPRVPIKSKNFATLVLYQTTYKRDLQKRIESINRVVENMNNPNVQICGLIENKMNEFTSNKSDLFYN